MDDHTSVDLKISERHGSAIGRFAREFTKARSLGTKAVEKSRLEARRGTLTGLTPGLIHAAHEDGAAHLSKETTLLHGFLMKKARSKEGSWLGGLQRHNWQERYVALMLPQESHATSSKLRESRLLRTSFCTLQNSHYLHLHRPTVYFHLDLHDEVSDAMGVITCVFRWKSVLGPKCLCLATENRDLLILILVVNFSSLLTACRETRPSLLTFHGMVTRTASTSAEDMARINEESHCVRSRKRTTKNG